MRYIESVLNRWVDVEDTLLPGLSSESGARTLLASVKT